MQGSSSFWVKYRADVQTCIFAMLIVIVIMIAEFGHSTFVSDFYHVQLNSAFPNDGFSADARFVPEFLFQTIFCSTYVPAIFLLMLIASLVFGGFLLIRRMNFIYGRIVIIPILVLALHPFLFVHAAYIVNRLLMSCAIIFSALAAFIFSGEKFHKSVRILLSGIILSLALMSYQPAFGIFLVCALFLHADALIERNLKLSFIIRQLIYMAAVMGLSLAIYEACVWLAREVHIIQDVRVHNMLSLPARMDQIPEHINALLKVLKKIVWERSQFFPTEIKWLLTANMVWLGASLFYKAKSVLRGIGYIIFVLLSFLSFYSTMFFVFPILPMPRMMPGLAFSWFFVFLLAWKYENRIGRSFTAISAGICVAVFAIQFNIMHERSKVKNEIDKQITWQIIERIQPIAGPRDEYKVIALVGVLSHRSMPYWTKYSGVFEATLAPDMIQSVYDYDWSKYRLLEFYYPCREPNKAQWQEAKKLVANSPLWPEEGSVVKGDGFIAVALSRP